MAIPTPARMPKVIVPTRAVIASSSSRLRKRASRAISASETSWLAAYTTTAPSAASGSCASRGPAANSTMTTPTAATREYTWVRAPAARANAVRDPDDDTGKPPTRPEATCTPASATSSWSGSIGWVGAAGSSAGAGKPRPMRVLSP